MQIFPLVTKKANRNLGCSISSLREVVHCLSPGENHLECWAPFFTPQYPTHEHVQQSHVPHSWIRTSIISWEAERWCCMSRWQEGSGKVLTKYKNTRWSRGGKEEETRPLSVVPMDWARNYKHILLYLSILLVIHLFGRSKTTFIHIFVLEEVLKKEYSCIQMQL